LTEDFSGIKKETKLFRENTKKIQVHFFIKCLHLNPVLIISASGELRDRINASGFHACYEK